MTIKNTHPELDDWWRDRNLRVSTETKDAAIHMLHEQAHGDVPYSTCDREPCRDLPLDLSGPAPRVLP